jgi:hypothetical protein
MHDERRRGEHAVGPQPPFTDAEKADLRMMREAFNRSRANRKSFIIGVGILGTITYTLVQIQDWLAHIWSLIMAALRASGGK